MGDAGVAGAVPWRTNPLVLPLLLLALSSHLLVSRVEAAGTDPWRYRGFAIQAEGAELTAPILEAFTEQVDIVLAVGLPAETIRFFQSIRIVLRPEGERPSPSPGQYSPPQRTVRLNPKFARVGHKPILLHELLHGFHHQKLPEGGKNPQVMAFLAEARSRESYHLASHMMSNAGEFFACSATTYLHGVTGQEPFRRDALKKEPALLAFLRGLFGPTAGKFQGSLTERVPRFTPSASPPGP